MNSKQGYINRVSLTTRPARAAFSSRNERLPYRNWKREKTDAGPPCCRYNGARAHTLTHIEKESAREREQRAYGDRERTDRTAAGECALTLVSRQPARLEDRILPFSSAAPGPRYSKYPVHHSIIEPRYGLAALFVQQRTAERLFVGNMLQKY